MKAEKAFEIDKKYELILNTDYTPLPDEAIRDVLMAVTLAHNELEKETHQKISIQELMNEIEWRWMSNRGSLPKRISKWYHDACGVSIPEKYLSIIGNLVRKSVVKDQTYVLDFKRKFNWTAGEFGDGGSCFWAGRDYIRYQMEADPRMHAIRFFSPLTKDKLGTIQGFRGTPYYDDSEKAYKGIARAWFSQETVSREKDDDYPVYVVFNGYGLTTKLIASVLASFIGGLSVRKIEVANRGSAVGGLYTNEGGYVVGDYSVIKNISAYDFGMPEDTPIVGAAAEAVKGTFFFKEDDIKMKVDGVGKARLYRDGLELKRDEFAGRFPRPGPFVHIDVPMPEFVFMHA